MPKKSVVIFFCLMVRLATAQQPADSLRRLLDATADPVRKADLLIQLSNEYRYQSPDTSFYYSRQAVSLIQPLKDSGRLATAEVFQCYYYYNTGKPDSGLQLARRNIDWLQKKPELLPQLANYYSISGLCCMKLDQKREALDRFYKALNYAEKAGDNSTRLKAYVNIGWAMMELNQFQQAITNFKTALAFIQEKNMPPNFTGIIYSNLASCFGSVNEVDSANKYAQLGIRSAHQYGDITTEANSLFILGSTQIKKGQLNEALSSYLRAQPLREKTGDPFFIVSDQAEISSLYAKLGRTQEGIATGEKALQLATENKISAKLPMIYSALASNYESANDYEKAATYYKKINVLKDSMYADANPQALAEMRTRYETEKQERLIEQQRNRLRMQNYLFIGIGGLVLLSGLLLHSWYRRNKLRQEAALKTELMKQQEMAVKAVIEAEENERQRIAKDLHDGVGQMMSAVKMNLSAFESDLSFQKPGQQASFEKIIQLVDDSCREVRTVSHVMMPNALLKNNLAAAIRDFVDKLPHQQIVIHVNTEGLDNRPDANTETVLYRVVQECVNNALRHARATTLDISLIRDKDGISGTIEDNGIGFNTSAINSFDGIGLKNIISRIEYLKGTVDFDSAPGRGTVVAFHVPA